MGQRGEKLSLDHTNDLTGHVTTVVLCWPVSGCTDCSVTLQPNLVVKPAWSSSQQNAL